MEKPPPFYIVFSPQGTTAPVRQHDSHSEALSTAHHMAKLHPGKEFFVMKSKSRPISAEAREGE
jgi:hypothetical protein